MFKILKKIWGPRLEKTPQQEKRKTVDTNTIRARIHGLGWKLREIPVQGNDAGVTCVKRWKLIAMRGERSCEVGGITLDEAMRNMGQTLGAIARN